MDVFVSYLDYFFSYLRSIFFFFVPIYVFCQFIFFICIVFYYLYLIHYWFHIMYFNKSYYKVVSRASISFTVLIGCVLLGEFVYLTFIFTNAYMYSLIDDNVNTINGVGVKGRSGGLKKIGDDYILYGKNYGHSLTYKGHTFELNAETEKSLVTLSTMRAFFEEVKSKLGGSLMLYIICGKNARLAFDYIDLFTNVHNRNFFNYEMKFHLFMYLKERLSVEYLLIYKRTYPNLVSIDTLNFTMNINNLYNNLKNNTVLNIYTTFVEDQKAVKDATTVTVDSFIFSRFSLFMGMVGVGVVVAKVLGLVD